MTDFEGVGDSLGQTIQTYKAEQEKERKKQLLKDFVQRNLDRLPPDLAASVATAAPPPLAPMSASALSDGQSDMPIPAEILGQAAAPPQPPMDINSLLQPGASPPLGAEHHPGANALRMLLEGTRDEVVDPKTLMDYIGSIGKTDENNSSRKELAEMNRDIQMARMQSSLDLLTQKIQGQKDVADIAGGHKETVAKTFAGAKVDAAKVGKEGKVEAAGIAAGSRANGKPVDPTKLSDDELEAELQVYGHKADSLNTAGMQPAQVGYKPAQEKQYDIDEAARQKDLSKTGERVTALEAEKAKRAAAIPGLPPAAAPASGGKVYSTKAEIMADLQSGAVKHGARVQLRRPDGSLLIVNTGK